MVVRKLHTVVEEISRELGRTVEPAHRVAVVAAVIENPWAGQGFVQALDAEIDRVAPELGALLAPAVAKALGRPAEAYGKAAIVGTAGEIEHGSALIHTLKFGDHLRDAVKGSTLLPAVEKRAQAGTTFDIPLKHITDQKIRSHHQTVEVCVPDAPHPDEIVIAMALSAGGRPLSRLAPLASEQ